MSAGLLDSPNVLFQHSRIGISLDPQLRTLIVSSNERIHIEEEQIMSRDQVGLPTYMQWQVVLEDYLQGLHERKREKALISEEMYELIYDVLLTPQETTVSTPQFRFWVRKMFKLADVDSGTVIVHDGKPVAVKEHIYEVLCMCHAEAGHAGRDKTCSVLRQYYTWIPKDLVAGFVKACPTCFISRSGGLKLTATFSHLDEGSEKSACFSPSELVPALLPSCHLNDRPVNGGIHSFRTSMEGSHELRCPLQTNDSAHNQVSLPPLMEWLANPINTDRFSEDNTLPEIKLPSPIGSSAKTSQSEFNSLLTPCIPFPCHNVTIFEGGNTPPFRSPHIPIDPALLSDDYTDAYIGESKSQDMSDHGSLSTSGRSHHTSLGEFSGANCLGLYFA